MRIIKSFRNVLTALAYKLNTEGDLHDAQAKTTRYRLDIEKFGRVEDAVKKLVVGIITVMLPPDDAREAIKAFYGGMGEPLPFGLSSFDNVGQCQHPEGSRKAILGMSGDVEELRAESNGADVVVFEGCNFRRTLNYLDILASGSNPFARWPADKAGAPKPIKVKRETAAAARLIRDILAGKKSVDLDLTNILPEGAEPYNEATDCPACDVAGCDGTPCDSAPKSGERTKGE